MQTLGGSVTARGLLPAALPPWLNAMVQRVSRDTEAWGAGNEANHVLVNAYEPGDGIQVCPSPVAFCDLRSSDGCFCIHVECDHSFQCCPPLVQCLTRMFLLVFEYWYSSCTLPG